MKTFESLFKELSEKAQTRPIGSKTVDELDKGTHFIGKKINEEAGRPGSPQNTKAPTAPRRK